MKKRRGPIEVERRYVPLSGVEVRTEGDTVAFTGHAAVFNEPADLFFFREKIAPGAFKKTIRDGADVRFLFNHEPDSVMARTTDGSLRLREDRRGLVAEADLDMDDWDVQRLVPKLERGDVSQMSFAFEVVKDEWDEEPEDGGLPVRTLREVRLFDVSPVTFPAYEATDAELVSVRSMLERSKHRGLLERKGSSATSPEAEQEEGAETQVPEGGTSRAEHSTSTDRPPVADDADDDTRRQREIRLERLRARASSATADAKALAEKVRQL